AAPAAVTEPAAEISAETGSAPEDESAGKDHLRSAVLNALAGHRMLTSMLEVGDWQVEGNELVIKVAASASVIDMSLGAEAKRLAIATASGALGRPVKLKVISGGQAKRAPINRSVSPSGGRGRVEQDPVVRRMKEKFGAEIRTIIDHKEKR